MQVLYDRLHKLTVCSTLKAGLHVRPKHKPLVNRDDASTSMRSFFLEECARMTNFFSFQQVSFGEMIGCDNDEVGNPWVIPWSADGLVGMFALGLALRAQTCYDRRVILEVIMNQPQFTGQFFLHSAQLSGSISSALA